jgi:hypothetical protein
MEPLPPDHDALGDPWILLQGINGLSIVRKEPPNVYMQLVLSTGYG